MYRRAHQNVIQRCGTREVTRRKIISKAIGNVTRKCHSDSVMVQASEHERENELRKCGEWARAKCTSGKMLTGEAQQETKGEVGQLGQPTGNARGADA